MRRLSRRAFVGGLAGLGASATGLVLASGCGALPVPRSQEQRANAHVGVVSAPARADAAAGEVVDGFLERIAELGWRNGDNLVVHERWANGDRAAVPQLAVDLVRLPVDVILAGGTAAAQAAKEATNTIPIVMVNVASDPVALGLVASLARPGGNVTGLVSTSVMLASKRLELLADLLPGLRRVALWVTPDNPSKPQTVSEVQRAADALAIMARVEDVLVEDLARAFESARTWPAQALLVSDDPVLRREDILPRLMALMGELGIPAVYGSRSMVQAGGLMSYNVDPFAPWKRAAEFVDKILRGANPADLPVEQPTTFQVAVNAKAAQDLGLTMPPHVLAQVTDWVQ
jgi:putative tryptophan/tyrosine transport system substrate-binding protein